MKDSRRALVVRKSKWLISISRNFLVIFACSMLAYLLVEYAAVTDAFYLTGAVDGGIPAVQLPWLFNLNATEAAVADGPFDIAGDLGIGLVMLPLVANLQQLAIAKFYTRKKLSFVECTHLANFSVAVTQPVHACQEMFALGVCNLLGSFVGSMAVVASLGRCAVNAASGARTPFGGIVTGSIVLMACAFLTQHFAYIPTAALSAVIISAMIFTVDWDIWVPMWKSQSETMNE